MPRMQERPCWHRELRLSVSHCRPLVDAPVGASAPVQWTTGASIGLTRTTEGVRVHWTLRRSGEAVSVPVSVAWQPQPFGGARPWWVCPCCGARRAELAVLPRALACRRCIGAVYPSSRACGSVFGTALARLENIERKLRPPAGWGREGAPPPRPKGMHHRTYDRLCDQWHQTLLSVYLSPEVDAFHRRINRALRDDGARRPA